MSGKLTEILSNYTTQAKIKILVLSSHEQLPARSYELFEQF